MVSLTELMVAMPAPVPVSAAEIRFILSTSAEREVLVVLDDDPTGTQSVVGLPVLTAWTDDDFRWAFSQSAPAVYVMTNSRSLTPLAAEKVTRDVLDAAIRIASELGLRPVLVSRSDSTLRGHFPLETTVMQESIAAVSGVVVVPAFPEAGRITVNGMHYCRINDDYLPVGNSEFAQDATFGYHSSALAEWVEEKTEGAVPSEAVVQISLTQLRSNLATVQDALLGLGGGVLICDIVCENDLRRLSLALINAEAIGRRFVYRVGPSFVRARIGQEQTEPLTPDDISRAYGGQISDRQIAAGGLVVVGSHVELTQRQLINLKSSFPTEVVELQVSRIVDGKGVDSYLRSLADKAVLALNTGSVILQTSRILVTGSDAEESLSLSRTMSMAVVQVVKNIIERITPRFVLAKGGITSSDVAAHGLGIRRATVVGPMLEGMVSLWLAQDGPAVGVPYVVFPGNVGNDMSLAQVVSILAEAFND